MVEERNIRELNKTLVELSKASYIDYIGISKCAEHLLNLTLEENYDIPVDIKKIIKELGIKMIEQPTDTWESKCGAMLMGIILKKKNRWDKENMNYIFINEELKNDYQRFIAAKNIGLFLLRYDDYNYFEETTLLPRVQGKEDMVANIFARFLLLPHSVVLREYSVLEEQYCKRGDYIAEEWYRYISNFAGLPFEEAAIGWQQIQFVQVFEREK